MEMTKTSFGDMILHPGHATVGDHGMPADLGHRVSHCRMCKGIKPYLSWQALGGQHCPLFEHSKWEQHLYSTGPSHRPRGPFSSRCRTTPVRCHPPVLDEQWQVIQALDMLINHLHQVRRAAHALTRDATCMKHAPPTPLTEEPCLR